MRKGKAKAKLVLRQEQIRVLESQELRHIVGGLDTEVANSCPSHLQAVATQAGVIGCG